MKKRTIAVIVNPRKENTEKFVELIDNWAGKNNEMFSFFLCSFNSPHISSKFPNLQIIGLDDLIKTANLIVTLGGDGTLLRTVTKLTRPDIDILGVNLGGLGFLADTPPEKLINHLNYYRDGEYTIDERTLLSCKINGKNTPVTALNDFVIDKGGFSRLIEIHTKVNNKKLNSYIADGLIISTPTGSTGYSLSAGGSIISPTSEVFQLNPICPHSLTNRPVIVADSSEIRLQVWTEHQSFTILRDGENVGNYPSGTKIVIKKHPTRARFVKMTHQNYFKTLSKKLRWGEDFRNKKRWTYQKD